MSITVRDVVEAARKNGLKHERGSYFYDPEFNLTDNGEYGKGEVGACIMGQAYYNLFDGLVDESEAINLVEALDTISGLIFKSDNPKESAFGLGSIMTVLNDRKTANGSGRYRTYSELIQAFEVRAKPFLDQKVEF